MSSSLIIGCLCCFALLCNTLIQRRGTSRLCFIASTAEPEWTAAVLRAMQLRPSSNGSNVSGGRGGGGQSLASAAGSVHMCGGESVKPALRALQKERDATFHSMLFLGDRYIIYIMLPFTLAYPCPLLFWALPDPKQCCCCCSFVLF